MRAFGFVGVEVSSSQSRQPFNLPLKLPFDVPQALAVCDRVFRHDKFASVHEATVFMLMLPDCGIDIIEKVGGSTKSSFPGVLSGKGLLYGIPVGEVCCRCSGIAVFHPIVSSTSLMI